MPPPLHCIHCGGKAAPIAHSIAICGACGREVYSNSKPTAGVLLEHGGKLLLVRRARDPSQGLWDIPGGFLEEGERPQDGAVREIREELGLQMQADDFTFAFTELNPLPEYVCLDLMYTATLPAGQVPVPADDVAAIGWFHPDELPTDELAFDVTRRILDRVRTRASGELTLLGGTTIQLDAAMLIDRVTPPFDGLPAGWRPEGGGTWSIHDGALCGRIEGQRPAALWLDRPVAGDHAIAFRAWTVPPHRADINCYWEGSGRILTGADTACTIGGIGGWWNGLSGIERHPEGGLTALGRSYVLQPGRAIEVVAGRRGCSDFLFIDGTLVQQLDDPTHPRRAASQVALATWDSHLHYDAVRVYALD